MRKLSDYPKGVVRVLRRRKKKKHDEEILAKYENKELYYVIRLHLEDCGLATTIRCVLSHVKKAEEMGWIPIVDYQTYPNPYLDESQVGKENAWNYFFEQPMGVELEEISGKENVLVTDEAQLEVCPTDSMEFYTNPYMVAYWRHIYRKYFKLSDSTREFVEQQKNQVLGEKHGKILGCILRGTDYVERRANNHPIQPSTTLVIDKAKTLMQSGEYEKLFLATEDIRILEQFEKEFGDRLVYVEQQRYDKGEVILTRQENFASLTSRREEGLKYLTAIYLLGECDALIGGRCGMTTISYIISNDYDYEYLWNIGRYRTDDYCLPEEYL